MESSPVEHQCDAPDARKGLILNYKVLFDDIVRRQQPSEGYTTEELSDMLDCHANEVRRLVKMATKAGLCRPAKKGITTISGTYQRVASYVFIDNSDASEPTKY